METIVIDNVKKSFKERVLFEAVNLQFNTGKVYGLIGENGIGKSVFMKCLVGFVEVDEGEIRYDTWRLGKDGEFAPDTGFLIESPAYIAEFTHLQNLQVLASINGKQAQSDLVALLESVKLDINNKTKVERFSLGMKQRLGIAMALVDDPTFVILDEPMNSLDQAGVRIVRELILQLKAQGKIILLTSHDYHTIELLCDEIYEMKDKTLKRQR